MKCVICGGKLQNQKVTFVYDHDNEYFLVENVPAEVCAQCGEKTYNPEVTDRLMHLFRKKLRPEKTVEVPVFDFNNQALV
ncbi:MAG: type II toxin-antitoxin system MqsA family antitoxin [Calditrichaeota bacterium]|nr:MAG: type II toxin-antitoxin system MqsA family antitoxin [Calditrichota bacterium]